MTVNTCLPCEGCNPDQLARGVDTYRQAVLHVLCAILAASGGGTAANDNELQVLRDRVGGTDTAFLRRYVVPSAGPVTTVDTTLDGVTPYVVVGTVFPWEVAIVGFSVCLRALVDSPADYPNPGDPIGTAYGIGDLVQWSNGSDGHNFGLVIPVIISIQNISNGTFPAPFWLQVEGVDLLGSQPNPADFTSCEDGADNEVQAFCDRDSGVDTPFLRRYVVSFPGVVTTVDTTLDGVTPYVVLGTVVPCAPQSLNPTIVALDSFSSTTITQSVVANGNTTVVDGTALGRSAIAFQVGGTWDGVLTPQITLNGTDWVDVTVLDGNGNAIKALLGTPYNRVYTYTGLPFGQFRLVASGWVSGTAETRATLVLDFVSTSIPFINSARDLNAGITGVLVKTGPTTLQDIQAFNINTTVIAYLKLYDKATAPVFGDTPVRTMLIPAQTGGAGFVVPFPRGINFRLGLGYRVTTAPADASVAAPAANEVILNLGYT